MTAPSGKGRIRQCACVLFRPVCHLQGKTADVDGDDRDALIHHTALLFLFLSLQMNQSRIVSDLAFITKVN